jgi:hypothetical protein
MAFIQALKGGGLYAVAMAGVGYATGAGLNVVGSLTDGAVMGGAIMADELTHNMLMLEASVASSAVVTGAWFAGLESVLRGDDRYLRNAGAGAVTGMVLDAWR